MNEIKTTLFQFIFSLRGAVITPVVILLLTNFFGWLTATVGVDIPPEQVEKNIASISNLVSDLTLAVMGYLFLRYVGNRNEDVQQAAGVKQDRWIGKKTVAKVKENRKDAAHAPKPNAEVKTTKRGTFLHQDDSPLCHE